MYTKHWLIHNFVDKSVENLIHNPQIQEAARWITQGEVVAFPTETVYGLGADALSEEAVKKIFEVKGRPSDNPLIVHIAHIDQLQGIVDNICEQAQIVIDAFWPGPLTLVLPKGKKVCQTVTAGLSTVAVRMPSHAVALAFIHACCTPIAAPSANRSGKPSPTSAAHVLEDLAGTIVGVLDSGKTGVGVESTVVDVSDGNVTILRPGGITKEELEQVVGTVLVDSALELHSSTGIAPRSPGVKYVHYAPKGVMWLVSLDEGLEKMRKKIAYLASEAKSRGYRVGILTTDEGIASFHTPIHADSIHSLGERNDLSMVARNMYQALRLFDQMEIEKIYAESFPRQGLGDAIMNRLVKASGGRIL